MHHEYSFYFHQQCTIYVFHLNNIYVIIIPTCFDTFVTSSGSPKLYFAEVILSIVLKISLEIIKLKYLCGYC